MTLKRQEDLGFVLFVGSVVFLIFGTVTTLIMFLIHVLTHSGISVLLADVGCELLVAILAISTALLGVNTMANSQEKSHVISMISKQP